MSRPTHNRPERTLQTGRIVRLRPGIEIPARALVDLCRRYQVRELAVFGSVLGPNFTEASDVDFLVEFAPEAQIGMLVFSSFQRELSEILQRPVDLVPKTGLKPVIRDDVLSQAEIVYAA